MLLSLHFIYTFSLSLLCILFFNIVLVVLVLKLFNLDLVKKYFFLEPLPVSRWGIRRAISGPASQSLESDGTAQLLDMLPYHTNNWIYLVFFRGKYHKKNNFQNLIWEILEKGNQILSRFIIRERKFDKARSFLYVFFFYFKIIYFPHTT